MDSDDVVTLYAVWEGITYYVKYNANGGSGVVVDQKLKFGDIEPLNTNYFTRYGYNFAGWARSQANADDGVVEYVDNQFVSNLTNIDKSYVNLYAVWEVDTSEKYNAHYDYMGNFWYIENGMMPQRRVTAWLNAVLESINLRETGNIYKVSRDISLSGYEYNGEEYCRYNGQWYHVDPIRWRLNGAYTKGQSVEGGQSAILASIVYVSAYSEGTTDYTNYATSTFIEDLQTYGDMSNMLEFSATGVAGQAKIFVASGEEVLSVAPTYEVEFSDLVNDILATRYYYTRDLGTDGNIKVHNFLGSIESQRYPTTVCGVQFIVKIEKFVCV